jgi:PAS domain S-box-containing protein
MKWEWAADTFKALILVAATWAANYARKKFIPFLKAIKRIVKVSDRVDALEVEVSIIESRLRAALHTDPNPAFIVDAKTDLIYANPAWGEMTGFSNIQDAYGKGYLKAIPPEDRDSIERDGERFAEHPSSYEGDVRFRHIKTKQIISTIVRSELVYDKNGELIQTIGRIKILT